MTAPIITSARHRILTDGEGVTTLVCFYGCPLRCKMCINGFTIAPDTKHADLTPAELYEKLAVDSIYFIATGGGVTFGGGEPLLYPDFIKEFRGLCGSEWAINVETSLNVPWQSVKTVAEVADSFIVDIKTADPEIYRAYTGKDNAQVLDNLNRLLKIFPSDKVRVRIPLIGGYNDEADIKKSKKLLESLGATCFDIFKYRIIKKK